MHDERFLVTGALGCLGSWTVYRLLEAGTDVVAFDLPGEPARLQALTDDATIERVRFVAGDVTDLTAFERTLVDERITHVIHLAALQVPFVRADPVRGAHVNVVGTTVVLEAVRRHRQQVQGLAYASSIGVYGAKDLYPDEPLAHDAELAPPTLYGVFKQANEDTARIFWEEHSLPSIGLRPYVVYGPGRDQGWTSTPTKAMLAAALGREYTITFGGSLVYHHAADMADVCIGAARTRVDGAPVFNVGGVLAHMSDVVAAIEEVVPSARGTISFNDAPLPHPPSVDDTEIRRILGEIRHRPLVEGVRDTLAVFEQARAAGRIDVERAISS